MTGVINAEPESAVKPGSENSAARSRQVDFDELKATAKPNFIELFELWKLGGVEQENGIYVFELEAAGHGKPCYFDTRTGFGKARGTDIIKLCGLIHSTPKRYDAAIILQQSLDQLAKLEKLRTQDQDDLENERERHARYKERSKRRASEVWHCASTEVDQTYFRARGIELDKAEPNVRFRPSDKHPVMVCKLSRAFGEEPECVELIALNADRTGKASSDIQKQFLGAKEGNGIWLGNVRSDTLHITEGFENALTLRKAGCELVVAAGDAGNLAKLRLFSGIKEIIIAADDDDAGRKGADEAAKAYKRKGRRIYSVYPPRGSGDWNDLLRNEGLVGFKSNFAVLVNAEKFVRNDIETNDGELDAHLQSMNERFFVINNYHGRCVIGEFVGEVDPETKLSIKRLKVQKKGDFYNRFANIAVDIVKGKYPKQKTLADFWFTHPDRRQYETVVFKPEQNTAECELNLWQGFSCEPREGDCTPILEFLRDIVCARNLEHFNYLLSLLALGVQKPWLRWGVAVVCRGGQGTGKGTLAHFFGGLFGQHYRLVNRAKHLTGEFNAHHRDALVMFADEALATEAAAIGTLKSIITEPMIPIQPKGFDIENYPNYLKIIVASNHANPVHIDPDDRRMFCLEFADDRKQDSVYFGALNEFYKGGGGKEAFLHHLKSVDISKFNPFRVPHSRMWSEGTLASLPIEETAALHLLEQGWFPGTQAKSLCDYHCLAAHLKAHLENEFHRLRDVHPRQLAKVWKKLGAVDKHTNKGTTWWFPELSVMRENWNQVFGKNESWNEALKWSVGSVTGDIGDPPF